MSVLSPLTVDFHQEIMKELGSLGILGPTLKEFGCAGASYVAYGLIAREIERYTVSFNSSSHFLLPFSSSIEWTVVIGRP